MLKATAIEAEKNLYRFILGLIAGVLFGNHVIPSLLGRTFCFVRYSDVLSKEYNLDNTWDLLDKTQSSGVVYIGMMSMDDKMESRVQSAMNTWMKHLHPGVKVEIFANNNGTTDTVYGYRQRFLSNGVRVIQLPGVSDHVYPPQKKSFSMVKFMHDKYIEKYDWFVRLDDDAYVDTSNLVKFLSGINSSKPVYMGRAGFGKHKEDYLDVDRGENYCMGGPGMIFSKGLLRSLSPHLKDCLGNLLTEHEDIELGRCVQKKTSAKCTTAWDTVRYFYQNFQGGTYAHNIKHPEEKDIEKGLTFHANKDSRYQHNFHVKLLTVKLKKLYKTIMNLENDIRRDFKDEDDPFNLGANVYSHLRWNAISRLTAYKTNDRDMKMNLHSQLKSRLLENTNAFIKQIQKSNPHPRQKMKLASLESTYHVVNPLFSSDFISRITFTYSSPSRKQDSIKEIKYIHQRQYFSNYLHFVREPSEIPISTLKEAAGERLNEKLTPEGLVPLSTGKDTAINFLTALSGRLGNTKRFLDNFEKTFLQQGANVNLIVVLFPNKKDQQDGSKLDDVAVESKQAGETHNNGSDSSENVPEILEKLISALQDKYPRQILQMVTLGDLEFSRGIGLQEASKYVTDENDILFFCDVDLVFAPDMLDRIRRNTIKGERVYYPVFFSQYDPDVVYVERKKPETHFHFDELDGFWRSFSYGMFSVYKSDFDKTKGFNTEIKGWGLEDVEMIKSILQIQMDIFQCNDPALVHIYHEKFCDPKTTSRQYSDCKKSRASHYGPRTLMYFLYNAPVEKPRVEEEKL